MIRARIAGHQSSWLSSRTAPLTAAGLTSSRSPSCAAVNPRSSAAMSAMSTRAGIRGNPKEVSSKAMRSTKARAATSSRSVGRPSPPPLPSFQNLVNDANLDLCPPPYQLRAPHPARAPRSPSRPPPSPPRRLPVRPGPRPGPRHRAPAPPVIEHRRRHQALRRHAALDGLDLQVAPGRGARLPRTRTAPARRRPCACCSACCAPTPGTVPAARRRPVARRGRPAPPPGLRARRRDAVAEPDRRRGDRPARPAARRRSNPSGAPRCSSASTSTRPRRRRAYSKGNRQKVALVAALASDVELLLLDEPTAGPGPADGGGCSATASASCASRARTVAALAATSSPRPRRCPTGSPSSAPAARWRPARWPSCATSPARWSPPTVTAVAARRWSQLAGRHDLVVDGRRVSAAVETAALGPSSTAAHGRWACESLTSAPPTLEELFLRHYQEAEMAAPP